MSAVVTPLPSVEPRRLGLKVMVRALKVEASIGFYDHEHGRLQPLVVDVELDLGAAPIRTLSDTLDYEGVARIARDLAAGEHIALVETFAERVALAPGASWHEQHRGTNAIGTALAEGAAVEIHGAEHFLARRTVRLC